MIVGIQGKKKKKSVFYFGTFYVCSLQGGGGGDGVCVCVCVCVCVWERERERERTWTQKLNFLLQILNKI